MDEDYTDENFNFENHEGDFVDPCCDTDKSHLPTLHQKNMTFAKRFQRFMLSKSLKEKNAVCQNRKIMYFRGDQFKDIVENYWDFISAISVEYMGSKLSKEDVQKFYSKLLKDRIILRLDRNEEIKYKYPKKLKPAYKNLKFEEDQKGNFYQFNIEPSKSYMNFMMLVGLFIIVSVCLFPIWPDYLKLVIFYVSLVLLYILLGISVIRLIIWFLLRLIGMEFWLFPNLNADVGPIESFIPVYEYNWTEDGWAEYVSRLFGLLITVYIVYIVHQDPEIVNEYKHMGQQMHEDIVDWGKMKIEGKLDHLYNGNRKAIPHLKDILNDTDTDNITHTFNTTTQSENSTMQSENQNQQKQEL